MEKIRSCRLSGVLFYSGAFAQPRHISVQGNHFATADGRLFQENAAIAATSTSIKSLPKP
jgi:hypothetical protein